MSNINWFPGHMHKAIKDIKEILPKVDLIIEVLDARIPYSSANPVIEQFRGSKPSLKVLSKSDLADPAVTQLWLDHFQKAPDVKAIAISTEQPEQIRGLTGVCKNLMGGKTDKLGNITALITGIPNVGKSTLINTLAGRTIAKTGNEPAITQSQQRIDLHNGLVLIDTPGILWPKIHNAHSGYRLGLSGAIKATAIDLGDVAFYGAAYFMKAYPELMKQRFKLATLPELELEFMEIIGKQRGCLGAGGRVDFARISSVLINEFRTATLGHISLETPEMAESEEILVQRAIAEKAAAEEEKKKGRKKAFQARKD
ncbi:MAG: ribosome biogenesis GTPase YlqF [Moraxellaceae bacterium]